jgi:hypothetical protein
MLRIDSAEKPPVFCRAGRSRKSVEYFYALGLFIRSFRDHTGVIWWCFSLLLFDQNTFSAESVLRCDPTEIGELGANGKGGRSPYDDRNPAWLMAGQEISTPQGRMIEWSQPEILLYEDDPYIRMSYPDLVEDDAKSPSKPPVDSRLPCWHVDLVIKKPKSNSPSPA